MAKKHQKDQFQNQKQELNLLDWGFVVTGVITSIIAVITNQGNPLIYTISSILALNCAIIVVLFTVISVGVTSFDLAGNNNSPFTPVTRQHIL